MDADHTGHDRPMHKNPKYFYDTPFALIAFILALLMIVPMSGRISPVPDARADGANGTCELIGTQQPDNTFSFVADPNDPDCTGGGNVITGITQTCNCQDGTSVVADLNASCNTSATCLNHGGVCSLLSCFVPPPDPEINIVGLDFFNSDSVPLTVYAFDPDTNALVLNQAIHAIIPLGNLVFRATTEVLTDHGLPASDRSLVRTWARDRVRAQIMTEFVNIIDKPVSTKICSERLATERSCEEDQLYDWLTHLVWKKRIATAQFALDQYRSWRYAVEFATCDWHSPSKKGIVTLTSVNGTVSNKSTPGCSPGVDGIPNTDTTSNKGSLEDVIEGRDDGETCFEFPKENTFQATTPPLGDNETMSYDALTQSRCAGATPLFDVSLAAHPPLEDFLRYGLALARKNEILTPGFASTMGNTYKDEAFGIGVGVAGLAAAGTAAAVYAKGGWDLYSKTIAPFVGRAKLAVEGAAKIAGISVKLASAIASFVVVIEVIGNIVTAILTLLDILEFNAVPIKLKEIVRASAGATEQAVKLSTDVNADTFTTGKPKLETLIDTDAGKNEIRFALVEAMSPEKDLSDRTAPLPDPNQFFAQKQQSGTPVTSSPLTHSLLVTAWDGSKPLEKQLVGLSGGWFTLQVTDKDGTVTKGLDLGIDYKDCDGKERRVWRVGGDEFVSMPMGTTAADFDLTKATKTKEFKYLSYDQTLGCLTARMNHAPEATGITASGTPTEGQEFTFTGIASDPDSDAVNLVWNFGDGTSTATGSPIQHTLADSGSLQVVLTPTDIFGAPGTTKTQSITVANVAPTATLPTPTAVNEGSPFTLSLTSPSDPSTADTQAGFQYAFNCGSGFGSFGISSSTSCSTTDNGNIAVAAKIKDKDGGENTYSATAGVNNVPPKGSLLFVGDAVPEGSSFTFNFVADVITNAFDPSPVDEASLQFAFNCGGGFEAYSGTNGVTCSTIDNGTLSVAGKIKDKDGGEGGNSGTMTVTNVAPTATFTAPVQAFTGESAPLAFSGQFDPSAADTTAGFTYTYSCPNGTVNVANTRAATATCKYLTTGTFTVGGTISDKDQGTTSYTASVTVISLQQALSDLRSQVVALNLNATRTSDLTTKIDNALQKLAQGKKSDASKQLQDFIKKVNDIVGQKLITAVQGKVLTDIANRIIAGIAGS